MALARWSPLDIGENLEDVVRRTFGDFGSSLLSTRSGGGNWMPALDAWIDGETLHVAVELPGVNPDDVDIEVDNGVLRVGGERKHEQTREGNGQGASWFRREMRYGSFERRIGLPDGIDAENVTASYDSGILDISIPLPAKPKTKVKVEVGQR